MNTAIYKTDEVPPQQRLSYWNDVVCDAFTELRCDQRPQSVTPESDFSASIELWNLDGIQLAKVGSTASLVKRSRQQIVNAESEFLMLHLQTKGSTRNIQGSDETYLTPGAFTLYASAIPYSVEIENYNEMLVVKIPVQSFSHYYRDAEQISGLEFDSQSPLGSMIGNYLNSLWSVRNSTLQSQELSSLGETALSMLATLMGTNNSVRATSSHSSVQRTHFVTIQSFIRKNLHRSELSPELVAAAANISTRYLRTLFSNTGNSCSKYILEQRLSYVAKELSKRSNAQKKIIEVAFQWGFNNAAYFSRAFKRQFGMTPRDYKYAALDSN